MDATKNGKLLYIDKEQLSAGATVAKAYGNMTDTALKNNLSLFNEKIKVYKENRRIKYSHRDTSGRELTPQQQEYFKDSKVRDENGRLKVMHHGAPNGEFTVFGDGSYFTDTDQIVDYDILYSENAKKNRLHCCRVPRIISERSLPILLSV